MQLTIQGLSKTYSNGVRALHDVSLTLPNGMFGLLGPNGAGKSSLMRTIATLQEADSGRIHLEGLKPRSPESLKPRSPEGPNPRSPENPNPGNSLELPHSHTSLESSHSRTTLDVLKEKTKV